MAIFSVFFSFLVHSATRSPFHSPFLVRVVFLLPKAVLLRAAEVNGVNVGLVDGFDVALAWIGAQWRGAVDAGDINAVARLDRVDEVVVRVNDDGVRRLTSRHIVRRFLQFDHLFVGEMRAIVDQRVGEVGVAMRAHRRLRNFATAGGGGGGV